MGELSQLARQLVPFMDFQFYAPRCLKIRAKNGRVIPFKMNRAQLYLHSRIEQQLKDTGKVRVIGLKGRQQGFSTYVEARFYHRTSMRYGKRAAVMTHLQDSTDALFEMVKRYHENCPAPLQPATKAASASRCCCPPESCPGNLFSLPGSPTSLTSSVTRCRISARGVFRLTRP